MRRNGKILSCEHCGTGVYVPLGRQKTFRFCSNSCHGKTIFGDKELQKRIKHPSGREHPRWKGGTKRKDGYILISVNGKRKFEHRYIMEEYIGRKLEYDETIHHIDGNRSNNHLPNLSIEPRSLHGKMHRERQLYVKTMPA